MFGCHNCAHKPDAGTQYEFTACAKCSLRNASYSSFAREYDEGYNLIKSVPPEVYKEEEWKCPLIEKLIQSFATAMEILNEFSKRHPRSYQVVMLKIRNPNYSYRDLANMLGCSKQNIQYHIECFTIQHPELKFLLGINTIYKNDKMVHK